MCLEVWGSGIYDWDLFVGGVCDTICTVVMIDMTKKRPLVVNVCLIPVP